MTDQELIKQAKAKAAREWRQRNSEKIKEYNRRWRQENKDKIKEHAKRWRENNPEKVKASLDKYWLKKATENSALDRAIFASQQPKYDSATNEVRQCATPTSALDDEIVQLKHDQPQLSNRAIARQLSTNDNRVRRVLKRISKIDYNR